MNAHINLDLAVVAATLCPGDAIYQLKGDFNRINDILHGLMQPIQDTVGRYSPLLHILWDIGGEADDEVLNFSIRVARNDAWQQAVTLAHLDPTGSPRRSIRSTGRWRCWPGWWESRVALWPMRSTWSGTWSRATWWR